MNERPRTLFFGTPPIAVPSLRALTEVSDVVGVVCQPDRRAGRGMKLRPPAVKVAAEELGIEVYQPEKVRDGSLAAWVRDKKAEVALVIAYGRILTDEVLAAAPRGMVNLHASLLPELRGAAPIQRAIMAGAPETGVCLMQIDSGMDSGDVLSERRLAIGSEENAGELAVRLGELAGVMTREEMPRLFRNELSPVPQDHDRATFAPPIEHEEVWLDFALPAERLCWKIRGLAPRPGAAARLVHHQGAEAPGRRVRLLSARPISLELQPGELRVEGKRVFIGCAEGSLEVLEAQLEGKKALSAADLANGRVLTTGDRLA